MASWATRACTYIARMMWTCATRPIWPSGASSSATPWPPRRAQMSSSRSSLPNPCVSRLGTRAVSIFMSLWHMIRASRISRTRWAQSLPPRSTCTFYRARVAAAPIRSAGTPLPVTAMLSVIVFSGWWQPSRGLVGAVLYEAERLVWSPRTHARFPSPFRRVVVALLLLWERSECVLSRLPVECLFMVIAVMDYNWFGLRDEQQDAPTAEGAGFSLRRSLKNLLMF